jgi:hypothetical protein
MCGGIRQVCRLWEDGQGLMQAWVDHCILTLARRTPLAIYGTSLNSFAHATAWTRPLTLSFL